MKKIIKDKYGFEAVGLVGIISVVLLSSMGVIGWRNEKFR